MSSILNNVSALNASRSLGIVNLGLQQTIERLTTGRRINRASDDAAGLGISSRLGIDIRVAQQAKRNANDGVSYLQIADGVLEEVTSLLNRGAELAEQAKTGTISDTNRLNLDAEFQNVVTTLIDIGQNARFNGASVFTTSTLSIAVGSFSPVAVTVGTIGTSTSALGLTGVATPGGNSLRTTSAASSVAGILSSALETVSNVRATLGATMQQLNSISNSLGIQVENFTAAFSQIRDASIADEVVQMAKFQILNQSGSYALTQANQAQQSLLALLR